MPPGWGVPIPRKMRCRTCTSRYRATYAPSKTRKKVDSWVYRVARNAVYDFYRTRKPTQELNELPSPTPDPTEDEMEARLWES